MQTHPKKQGYLPSRYHQAGTKGYPQQYPTHQFHQTATGDVGGYGGGPGGAAGVQVRLAQFAPQQQGPQIRPSAPTNPHQAPHTPHNNGPPPQHSQHTHPSVTLSQHSQHHPVLQNAGAAGVGSHVPGPSPAPPGAHEMNTQGIPPPGTSQQLQQGSGSLPVSAHNMIYGNTSQSQPQGPQANAQSFPVMPPSVMQYFQNPHSTGHNIVYQIPFQPMAARPTTPQNQYPPQLPAHPPQGHYPPMFQTQGVFYPPTNTPQQPIKAPPNATPQQRESRRIAIIDPHTGKNILDDVSKENSVKPDKTPTPPTQSSEASASNTPAPSGAPQKEDIAAQFAADVARRAADTESVESDKVDGLERTNKPYEPNSMVIISSDQIKDKSNSSIATKDSELEESVDSLENKSVSVSAVDSSQAKQAEIIQMPLKPIQQQIQQRQQSPEALLISKKQQQVQQQPPPSQQPQPQQPLLQQPIQQTTMLLHQQAQQQQQQQQQVPPQQPQQQQQQQQQQQHQQQQQQQQPVPQPEIQTQQQKQLPQEKTQSKVSPVLQSVPQPTSQSVTQGFSQSSIQPPVQQITQAVPQVIGQPAVSPSSRPGNKVAQATSQAATQQSGSHGQQSSVTPDNPLQHQSKSEPEPQQPPKQPSPKPEVVLPSRSKEKEHTPEPPLESNKRRQMGGAANREDTASAPSSAAAASSGPAARETAARQPSPSPSPQPQSQPPQPQPPQSQPPQSQPPQPQPPQPQVAHAQPPAAHPQQPPAPNHVAAPAPTPAAAPQAAAPPAGPAAPPAAAPAPAAAPPQAQREPAPHQPSNKSPERPPSSGVKTPPVQQNSRGATPSSTSSQPVSKESTPQPEVAKEDVVSERNSVDRQSNAENEYNNVEHAVDGEGDADETSEKTPASAQLKYTYKEDQWSPANQDGKRQYDRNFLLELQNNPLSLKKPESLPNLEVVKNGPPRSKPFDSVTMSKNMPRGPDFMPNYVRSAGGTKGPKAHIGGRSSTSGRRKVINIQLSSGSEVKLRKSEDAWKPTHKDSLGADNEEELKTQECLKKMRGILNKLTPEKFEKLVESVRTLPINTTERLSGVIDLIFEKAVDEQAFSSTYAQMCQVLCHMSVKENENESGKGELKFRNVIITKCQKEFEKDNMDELKKEERVKDIEKCGDNDKKLELRSKLEYDEIKLRKRSVGNIRFIGELYKLKMLTSPIMMRIIGTLLDKADEESLECLCKLLTTIGKQLETSCSQKTSALEELDKQFRKMEKIINSRATSSRVRFLMLDVVELRQQGWKPRREENNPKTKAAVHEEVKREEIEQQVALSQTPARRDDNKDRKRSRDNRGMTDEGWSTVNQKSRSVFDSSRMKAFIRPGAADTKEVQLRGSGFSSWGRGSSGGMKDQNDEQKPTSNRYTVLEDGGDNRWGPPMGGTRLAPGGGSGPRQGSSYGSKSMPPPNDKHDAISMVKKFVGSTDQSRSRDSSMTREPVNDGFKGSSSLTEDQANKLSVSIIEEFTSNVDVKEASLCIREKFSSKTVKLFIQHSFEWVLDRDKSKRVLVGQLYHDLIMSSLLTVDSLVEGCKEIICMTEDYFIDIPQVCMYIGEILAPCLVDNAVKLNHIKDLALSAGVKGPEVLALTVAQAATLMSPKKVVEQWNAAGLDWSVLVPKNTEDFLKKHKVEFTVNTNVPSVANNVDGLQPLQPQQQTHLQKIQAELIKLFKRAQNDEIFDWIDANIGNNVKVNKFIRALVTALVESQFTTSEDGSSVVMDDKFEERLKLKCNVILKYVDGNETLELQCVYALQALSVKHQHPPGLLEKCFNTFYDSDVISEEAFDTWVKTNDPEEQDGKGVCVNSVRTFLCWLREAEPADEGEPVP